MTLRWILTIYVCFFYEVLSMHLDVSKEDRSCHKLNVVLFFANSFSIPTETPTVKYLGLNEIVRVKHCVSLFADGLENDYVIRRNAPDCTELLNEGLASLTHFCQNALGMKTAIVSVTTQDIAGDINENQETPEEMLERQLPSPENIIRTNVFSKSDNRDMVPSFSKSNVPNFKEMITSPVQTEVFNIRIKRQSGNVDEKPEEIVRIPLEKENNKIPWDVLNFMGRIKYSFFGKLFDDKTKTRLAAEENHIPGEISINNNDPGLFETIKSTLISLQETPGEGFLMVIFGGQLSELSNNNSPLVQSVKHIIESTEPESTLIVLTGTCLDSPGQKREHENMMTINGAVNTGHSCADLPIFAKGPNCEKLKECLNLHDIPLLVKNILEETSPNFGDAILSARQRRSIFKGIHINKKRYNSGAAPSKVNDEMYFVVFYLFTSILFIL